MHWWWYHAGLNSGNSPWYLFWSGVGAFLEGLSALAIVGTVIAAYRKANCHHAWCLRVGRLHDWEDPETHVIHRLCARHHPAQPKRSITREHLHIYVGKKPGRG